MNKQHINGNHNQQAGNDIINNFNDDDFDPNNPNIIDCPCCWKPTSKFANKCPRCGYAVLNHLEREVINKEIKPLLKKRLKVACTLLVSSLLFSYYFSMPMVVVGVLVLCVVYISSLDLKIERLDRVK